MTERLGEIRVGTAAWSDHQEFYPKGVKPGDRITYYAEHFPVVEVNASYYHIMPARNYAGWAEKTNISVGRVRCVGLGSQPSQGAL